MSDDVMPDEREDPSGSTEAFRAFAQVAEPDSERKPITIIATLAVMVAVVALIILILVR